MAMTSDYREQSGFEAMYAGVLRIMRTFMTGAALWRSFHRSSRDLSRLSPRLLHDIGLDAHEGRSSCQRRVQEHGNRIDTIFSFPCRTAASRCD